MKSLNERGSVLVWITLMIVLLMVMVGMGLDTGQLTYSRATGQAAVDAAALSAVSAIPAPGATLATVQARAMAFNGSNTHLDSAKNTIEGASVTLMEYNFSNGDLKAAAGIASANAVRVALEDTNPYSGTTTGGMKSPLFLTPLLKLLGLNSPNTQAVNVSAVAVIKSRPSIPIALWSSQCNGSTTVPNVKIRQQEPGSENSCWTCYLDNSCGSKDVKALFQDAQECSGSIGDVDKGTSIYENKGQQASDYQTAYDFFFVNYPDREWLIPVINGTGNCNEKNPTPIVDWAKIKVTNITKNGAHSYIQADVTCNQTLNQTLGLCFSHRLVRDKPSGM